MTLWRRWGGLVGLALTLVGCAPRYSVPLTTSEAFAPTAAELSVICASVQITDGGLSWTVPDQSAPGGRLPPYTLRCPTFSISETETQIAVKAASLDAALKLFAEESYLLVYVADQRVRFPEPGLIVADPWSDLDPLTQEQNLGISVRVTPGGQMVEGKVAGGTPAILLARGQLRPVRYDPQQPLVIELNGTSALIWRKVQIEAAQGVIRAFR